MKILCVGDIHLGKRPSGLPDELGTHSVDAADLTPVRAWNDTTHWAVDNNVDLVLLAGDVVHHSNDRYEAFGPLLSGVERCVAAGIQVCAVAGNHDGVALPRLSEHIPELRLLGKDGTWEALTITASDGSQVELLGWSFPSEHFDGDPLASMTCSLTSDIPTIGLLHCDLDQAHSQYAPVARRDLERVGADLWVLGHIHIPSSFSASDRVGYLGALVGLNPKETGRHGPWLFDLDRDGSFTANHIPLGPLRWETIEVPGESISGDDMEDIRDSVQTAVEAGIWELSRTLGDEQQWLRAVGCRIRITGRCAHRRQVNALREELRRYCRPQDGRIFFIEDLVDNSRPALDLARIAEEDTASPRGLLAQHLLALENGDATAIALVRDLQEVLAQELSHSQWGSVPSDDADTEDERKALLLEAGWQVLEEML